MNKVSVTSVTRGLLAKANAASAGRSAETVYGGHEHVLRQSVVVLCAHRGQHEHVLNGEGTIYVLSGRVRLHVGSQVWDARTGDLLALPSAKHSVEALEDSAVLVTVAMPNPGG
jgi:quercetin dioxygenase-like cupin family protein